MRKVETRDLLAFAVAKLPTGNRARRTRKIISRAASTRVVCREQGAEKKESTYTGGNFIGNTYRYTLWPHDRENSSTFIHPLPTLLPTCLSTSSIFLSLVLSVANFVRPVQITFSRERRASSADFSTRHLRSPAANNDRHR